MSYEFSEDQLIKQASQTVLEEPGSDLRIAWKNESFGPGELLDRFEHLNQYIQPKMFVGQAKELFGYCKSSTKL